MELYHNDMSVCAAKVRLALAEKEINWIGHHLNLRAGDALRPEYLRLNPDGVVPTLIDKGNVITESTVICEYLEDAYPVPPLTSSVPFERAKMRLWTKQIDEGVHASVGVVSTCIAFRYQHLKKSPEALASYLTSIPNAERRDRIQLAIDKGMESPMFRPAIQRFRKLLGDMDNVLREQAWLAGNVYSLADLAYTPYIIRLNHLGLDIPTEEYTQVRSWIDRLKARPSFKKGIEKWLNESYLDLFRAHQHAARERVRRILTQE